MYIILVPYFSLVLFSGYHPSFCCANWDSYTPQQFFDMAYGTSRIGQNGRKCRISRGGPTTACNHYVKYNTDGSNTWLGLSFQGVPGAGSGCCSSVSSCSTEVGAGAWLKSQHKEICCGPQGTYQAYTDRKFELKPMVLFRTAPPVQFLSHHQWCGIIFPRTSSNLLHSQFRKLRFNLTFFFLKAYCTALRATTVGLARLINCFASIFETSAEVSNSIQIF